MIDIINNSASILGVCISFIFSFGTILLLTLEMSRRRKLRQEELKFQKDKYEKEKELLEQRLEFDREKYKNEKVWIEQRRQTITEFAEDMSLEIIKQLKNDVSWASVALEKAKIKPNSQTIFAERWDHFRKEKEFIADTFLIPLMKRLKFLSEQYSTVYLLIDSGTTLHHFFEKIGKFTVDSHLQEEEWIKKITLITNNLPGIDSLMQHGRIQPNYRYSPIAIECKLLPGAPLPVYSAVTGDDTITFLKHIKKVSKNAYVLSLTTGNWIRIRRSTPSCPIPLARGKGHLEFKEAIFSESNEIYVISPLGKIFANADPVEVNTLLNLDDAKDNDEYHEYKELNINDKKAQDVYIITTSRNQKRILGQLSIRISTILGLRNEPHPMSLECEDVLPDNPIGHKMYYFNELPMERDKELSEEFPHNHTRKNEFMSKFFYVDLRTL